MPLDAEEFLACCYFLWKQELQSLSLEDLPYHKPALLAAFASLRQQLDVLSGRDKTDRAVEYIECVERLFLSL